MGNSEQVNKALEEALSEEPANNWRCPDSPDQLHIHVHPLVKSPGQLSFCGIEDIDLSIGSLPVVAAYNARATLARRFTIGQASGHNSDSRDSVEASALRRGKSRLAGTLDAASRPSVP